MWVDRYLFLGVKPADVSLYGKWVPVPTTQSRTTRA